MKNIFVLIFLLCFLLCGCKVSEVVINSNVYIPRCEYNIRVVLGDVVPKYIEDLSLKFEMSNSDTHIEFVRFDDDVNYRANVLDEILNKNASVIFVHGGKDVNFFKYLLYSFDGSKYSNMLTYIEDVPAFRVGEYVVGLFANCNLLNKFKIPLNSIRGLNGLKDAICSIKTQYKHFNKNGVFCKDKDLSSIFCSVDFNNGELSKYFEDIVEFLKENSKNTIEDFMCDRAVFYIGSARTLNLKAIRGGSSNIKYMPLPLSCRLITLKEEDYFCITKNNSKSKNEKILKFLGYLSKNMKFSKDDVRILSSNIINMPPNYKNMLEYCLKFLNLGKLSFSDFKNYFKKEYEKYKMFDISL